jgi:hypothetical protein
MVQDIAQQNAQRNYRRARAAFLIAVVAFSIELLTMAAYVYLIYSAQSAIADFGWGNVPPSRLSEFIWLSGAMEPILIGCVIVSGIATMFLFYFAALSLQREGVKQYFGPALTAWSVLIPFYGLYRPWAGLGEVRNTLLAARAERRLPAAGIRGANAATVFYAIMIVIYSVSEEGVGKYASDIMATSDDAGGAEQFNSYVENLSGLFSVNIILAATFLIVVLWYWIGMLRLIKTSLSLEPASDNLPPPLPAVA